MKFAAVAAVFDALEKISSRTDITKILAQLLGQASAQEALIISNLSLGQLHPPYIPLKFNFAERNFIKVIAQVLTLSVEHVQHAYKKSGDVGSLVQQGGWHQTHDLSVQDVYQALERFEQLSGSGSQEEKINSMAELIQALDPLSAKFVIRIVVGKLRLGFSDMTLIDAFSYMAAGDKSLRAPIEHAYNICADIGIIAHDLKKHGIAAIEKMQIRVGIPIRPAAAERLPTPQAIMDKMGQCIAQPKLDGFRLQVHVYRESGSEQVKFFSRHLQDMSAMFPDIHRALEHLRIKSVIFEGEAIVYDVNTNTFLRFQETVRRKRKHDIEQIMAELPLQLFVFDMLYLDGKSLLSLPTHERRTLLEDLFKHIASDTIKLIPEKIVHTTQELELFFTQAIDAGLEGLVLKRPDAPYQPGKRNFNWVKLKRHHEGAVEDTIDCAILGYYGGKGKRSAFGIGAFLVGVYDKKTDQFETIARVGSGLKDDEWRDLKKKCDNLKVPEKPKNVVCAKELYPDVWVHPQMVCEIRADEITLSPMHTAGKIDDKNGFALRFPRIMNFRADKKAQEATTVDEIKRMYKDQYAKK